MKRPTHKFLMKLAGVTCVSLLILTTQTQAESFIQGVDFSMDNDKASVMVKVDALNLWDLFTKNQTIREFDYDSGVSLVQVGEIDPELLRQIFEQHKDMDPGEVSTHWSRNAGKYKTAAVVAAIGTAVALIVSESKSSSGRDQNITAGGNVNFNSGTVGGNNGNQSAEAPEFEGLE